MHVGDIRVSSIIDLNFPTNCLNKRSNSSTLYNLFSLCSSNSYVDLDENRLKVAKDLGADMTFKISSRDGKVVADQIRKEFGRVDKTIECTGAESSIHTAIYVSALNINMVQS